MKYSALRILVITFVRILTFDRKGAATLAWRSMQSTLHRHKVGTPHDDHQCDQDAYPNSVPQRQISITSQQCSIVVLQIMPIWYQTAKLGSGTGTLVTAVLPALMPAQFGQQ